MCVCDEIVILVVGCFWGLFFCFEVDVDEIELLCVVVGLFLVVEQ